MDQQRRRELARAYKERALSGGVFMIANAVTGKKLLQWDADLKGSRNRFEFSRATDHCTFMPLADDWKRYGADSFTFTVLEELKQGENQSAEEFQEELAVMGELWRERLGPELY